jgi:hypothetical protein
MTDDGYHRESDNHPDDPNTSPEPLAPEQMYESELPNVDTCSVFICLDRLAALIGDDGNG